ncbi:NADH-dependent dehydrogenase [Planctomycetales bacterium]|nr:NADH-dependent dehydrogenase [Planctomycetales bacterium]
MHLTTEQRNIGKENFYATIGSDLLRRDLCKKVNASDLKSGSGLGNEFFGYGAIDKPVRVAVLGTGDEANVLIGAINPKYVQVVAIADVRPFNQFRAFHGDLASPTAAALRTGLIKKYGYKDEADAKKHIRVYGDYKELLAAEKDRQGDDSVEAVIIGLPLWLHASAAIAAMQQGWHVLTEKLMAHSVANCKEMARAANQYKKHCAIGHQRHYNVLYDHAVKLLQSGVLGDLHYIRAQWHRNNRPGADSWKQPLPTSVKEKDGALTGRLDKVLANYEKKFNDPKTDPKAKATLAQQIAQTKAQIADEILMNGGEYNGFKFKSAKDYGYEDAKLKIDGSVNEYDRPALEELIRWRLYDRTSAGLMAELGSHQLDAASIFIAAMHGGKKQYPLAVSATATRTIFPTELKDEAIDRDVDDHIHCVFDYAGPGYNKTDELGKQRKITVAYSSINGNGFGGYGETVFGTKGTLLIETEKEALLYERNQVEKKIKVDKKGKELILKLDDDGDPLSAAIGLQATYGDVSRGYCEQIEHWAFCVRNNPEADHGKAMPRCYPEVALADAVIALTTNIAAKKGETVEFDPAWFDAAKDETPEAKFAETPELQKHFTPDLKRYA